jgi:hypothetical protein
MKKVTQISIFSCLFMSLLLTAISTSAQNIKPDADNAGLSLPARFAALKVADNVGRTRHIAVNKQGAIYAKLERLDNGKGIVVLKILMVMEEQKLKHHLEIILVRVSLSKEIIYMLLLTKKYLNMH